MTGAVVQFARVAAVVPAAGLSSRFAGDTKLLASLDNVTVIERVVQTIRSLGLSEILVITGHDREPVEEALAETGVRTVFNAQFSSGMGTSIATGVRSASDADYFLIWPGDMPGISPETAHSLLKRRKPGWIMVPVKGGRRGHPVLFSGSYRSALLGLASEAGARSILTSETSRVLEISVSDPAIHADIDTREDLREMRAMLGF